VTIDPRGEHVFVGAWDPEAPAIGVAERLLRRMPSSWAAAIPAHRPAHLQVDHATRIGPLAPAALARTGAPLRWTAFRDRPCPEGDVIMRASRVVMLVVGVLLALAGLALGAAGTGLLVAYAAGGDQDGYLTSPTFALETETHAVTAEELEFTQAPGDWTPWGDRLDLRVTVTPAEGPVFVGIAPRDDVAAYLDGVAHDELQRLDLPGATYLRQSGQRAPAPPSTETFWAESVEGTGTQTLTWTAQSGQWAVVVMNADASPGVAVEATAGAHTDLLLPIGIGLLIAALVLLGAGAALIVAAVATSRAPAPAATVPVAAHALPVDARVHPVVLVGHLDPQVGRWQWLVKWLLLVPHLVVLVFLWVAFVVLTIVAGVAILFTGRYPPALFEFNLGVLRWSWRVGFYGYSALGTDRYPPFTLDRADYPADLDIAYPTRLSRGLVLVKWWLLAIPHYLIVAVLTGGGATWTYQVTTDTSWQIALGGGLIGVLVLVAGVALLFTARYPAGLFELIVGLNRWVYRVIAYAALMTDQYPPFRLDLGGDEPRPAPPTPTAGPAGAQPPMRTPQHT
jgi:hypothetical protein